MTATETTQMPEKKARLLQAAVRLILRHGFTGTTIDMLCAEAGVTKGTFFHYFSSKEEIARAAMDAWSDAWEGILSQAALDRIPDPLDRLDQLFDVMAAAYTHPEVDAGCVVGTIAQEQALPNEAFRSLCFGHFERWVEGIAPLLSEAKAAHPPVTDFDPVEVAWWLQSFVQGTMVTAKARGDRQVTLSNVRHCRAYVMGLFGRQTNGGG